MPVPELPEQEDYPFESVVWTSDALSVLYGATFSLTTSDPHRAEVEEAYQFVEMGRAVPSRVFAYCTQDISLTGEVSGADAARACPRQELQGGEIRLNYELQLAPTQYASQGYLYEELVLSAKPVWVLLGADEPQFWRLLNRFDGLRDPFGTPGNRRMTTLHLPRNTFVALDLSEREESPSLDIVHFPRQFFAESLSPRSFVITRVNPNTPGVLRWSAQRYLSMGIESIAAQWLLLSAQTITPFALVGWLWRLLRRRSRSEAPPTKPK